jgi:hypothetical protein
MRPLTVQPPSVAGPEPDRELSCTMTTLGSATQAVPVSRDTLEPPSSGSPPDDALGESRPVKPDDDDTLGDGSARDSTTGHSEARQGSCRPSLGPRGPETEPATGRVPTVWEAPPFSAGEDVTTTARLAHGDPN